MKATTDKFIRALSILGLAFVFSLTAGCGGGGGDDDDSDNGGQAADNSGGSSSDSASGDNTDSGDSDARTGSGQGRARIRVCSEASGPVTVSVNGDTLENNRVDPGGTLFVDTRVGMVTFNATADGVMFMPVTVDMQEASGDSSQSVDLKCMSTGGNAGSNDNNNGDNNGGGLGDFRPDMQTPLDTVSPNDRPVQELAPGQEAINPGVINLN